MKCLLFVITAVAVCFSAYASRGARNGVWTAELEDDHLEMTLFQGDNNLLGFDEPVRSFAGLCRSDLTSSAANVRFQLRRAAGALSFEGRVANGTGAGHYHFVSDDAFVREMESLGYRGFSDEQLLLFAAHDFSPQTIRDLRAMGYQLTQREVEEIAIFRLTADLIREFARMGYRSEANSQQPSADSYFNIGTSTPRSRATSIAFS